MAVNTALSFLIALLIAAGAWQLIAGDGGLGFVLFLVGAAGGLVYLLGKRQDPSRFGAALEAVLQWISSLR